MGPGVFPRAGEEYATLGILNSKIYQYLLNMLVPFGSYEIGVICRIPVPETQDAELNQCVQQSIRLKQALDRGNETSHLFVVPGSGDLFSRSVSDATSFSNDAIARTESRLQEYQSRIDDLALRLYGIEERNLGHMKDSIRQNSMVKAEFDDIDSEDEEEPGEGLEIDHRSLARDVISYAAGVVLGRWDVRYATGERRFPELPDPFSSLPECSPGMLQGSDGLPLKVVPERYAVRIDWDGIFVDDPDHCDDITRRVRDVLEVIWKDRADAIEREACEILGVADLRDYFRKPGAGGFWDDHVKRYSKSRRKAPIYWLLQSSKKNYALWIYYHRLDKDILFKALLNYVEPKIRREESRLDELRSQKTALGPAAKGAKKLDKDIDRQESFLSELRDFEDKLRRAANLHLDPDLNDGVVLNIAPLRELVPWKEAKSYWDDLMDGKYEWSSIGKQLREKGIVPC